MTKPPGHVLGALQITGVVTAALGLPIGGILVDAWGWRTLFFVNIPFAIVAWIMTILWIPKDEPQAQARHARTIIARLDTLGILFFAATISTLMIFLFALPRLDGLALGLSIVSFVLFILREWRTEHPFLDLHMLAANGPLLRTYLRFTLITLCIYTVLYGLTTWISAVRGASSFEAGLLILPVSVVSAIVVAPLSKRNIVLGPLFIGAITSAIASLGMVLLSASTSIVWIIIIAILFGVTMGTIASASQTALYMQVTSEHIGTASGLFRTFGYLGSIASSALIGVVFHTKVSDAGLHQIALIMVIVSVIALILTLIDRQLSTIVKALRSSS
jgi:MFS family permease